MKKIDFPVPSTLTETQICSTSRSVIVSAYRKMLYEQQPAHLHHVPQPIYSDQGERHCRLGCRRFLLTKFLDETRFP